MRPEKNISKDAYIKWLTATYESIDAGDLKTARECAVHTLEVFEENRIEGYYHEHELRLNWFAFGFAAAILPAIWITGHLLLARWGDPFNDVAYNLLTQYVLPGLDILATAAALAIVAAALGYTGYTIRAAEERASKKKSREPAPTPTDTPTTGDN